MRRLATLATIFVSAFAAGCGDDEESGGAGGESGADTQRVLTAPDPRDEFGCVEAVQPDPKPDGGQEKPSAELTGDYSVTFTTNCGSFTVDVDETAGLTAASFVQLAEDGFYDETFFHRIAPGFVIQGGDPLGTGLGGPGYMTRDAPAEDATYPKYTVAMAKGGTEPAGTAGSQFFVMTGDGGLPAQYAIVGEVTRGKKVIDTIGQFGDPSEVPTRVVEIEKATVRGGP